MTHSIKKITYSYVHMRPGINFMTRSHWGNSSKNVIIKDLKDESHPED